jgi:type I restriction enzyme S subunit
MKIRSCQLGEVIKLQRGHDLPERVRQEGEVPVVTSSGITGFHNEAKAKAPGVVTGRYGTLGEVFYLEQDYWPHNTALYVVDFKGTHPRFASYFLRNVLRNYQSDKAAVPGIDRNVLHALEVRVPVGPAQQTIAGILSAYDEAMENNRRRMGLLEKAARLLYEEWFVRLRFPGHEHTPITHGIPQGWERKRLDAVAEVNRTSLPGCHDGEIEYVDISSVVPGQITETSVLEFRDAPSRARRIVQHGDIIWSCVRPNRRSYAVIWNPPENLIVSTGFAVITPTAAPTSFLYCATTTDAFVGYLENHAKGAAYPAVVAGDFERASVLIPTKQVLLSFNEVVEPIFSQIHNLRRQNQKLRAARDLLLPRLMSGEISV